MTRRQERWKSERERQILKRGTGKGDDRFPPGGSVWGCRLREAEAKEVCCLRRGAVKVQAPGIGSTPRIPLSPDTAKPRTVTRGRVQPSCARVRGVATHQTPAYADAPAGEKRKEEKKITYTE